MHMFNVLHIKLEKFGMLSIFSQYISTILAFPSRTGLSLGYLGPGSYVTRALGPGPLMSLIHKWALGHIKLAVSLDTHIHSLIAPAFSFM